MTEVVDMDLCTPELSSDVLGAMMLWPNDPQMRANGIATNMIKRSVENLRRNDQQLTSGAVAEIVEVASQTVPHEMMAALAKEPFVAGVRAGFYLYQTVGAVALDLEIRMKAIAIDLAKGFPGEITPQKFRAEIWPVYRPVSHFWAAALYLNPTMNTGKQSTTPMPFPCNPTQLLQFLQVAEGFRALGEKTKAKQSPHLILPDGACVRINPGVVPSVLEFIVKSKIEKTSRN
jgi:hypothetical protein